MDTNCPVFKSVHKEAGNTDEQSTSHCPLYLYNNDDDGDQQMLFGNSTLDLMPINQEQKQEVQQTYQKWSERPQPNQKYIEKSKYNFFGGTFDNFNSI